MRTYRRMTYKDRLKLESLYNTKKFTLRALAAFLGFSPSTICDELKHGYYNKLNSDYTETKRYSADRAQQHADFSITTKRPPLKIGNDYKFVEIVEALICKKRKSPEEIVRILKEKYPHLTQVCTTTLYNYIYQGFFPKVTEKNLFFGGKRRRKPKTTEEKTQSLPHGRSIEERPAEINNRAEFGHWEMDSVIGKREHGNTVVVLTERKTRMELVFRSKDKTALATVKILNKLEHRYGKQFKHIFKTITVDNGCEFSANDLMEKSIYGSGKRTTIYHCHPYSSWERGSNENQNRFIRLFIPKGVAIDTVPDETIAAAQDYINTKLRRMFGYRSSQDLFNEELQKINIL